jgi:hypothetical protein
MFVDPDLVTFGRDAALLVRIEDKTANFMI